MIGDTDDAQTQTADALFMRLISISLCLKGIRNGNSNSQQQQKQQLSNSNSNSLADTSQKTAYRRLQPAVEMSFKDILEVFAGHPTVLNSRATGINFSAR